jgi:hypothetical protein
MIGRLLDERPSALDDAMLFGSPESGGLENRIHARTAGARIDRRPRPARAHREAARSRFEPVIQASVGQRSMGERARTPP